jgi:hypothetical protein
MVPSKAAHKGAAQGGRKSVILLSMRKVRKKITRKMTRRITKERKSMSGAGHELFIIMQKGGQDCEGKKEYASPHCFIFLLPLSCLTIT